MLETECEGKGLIAYFIVLSGLIKQFLRDVDWGQLDYLLIDTPPGTSDEHLSIVQYLSQTQLDGAIVLTTPQVMIIILWSKIFMTTCHMLKSDGNCEGSCREIDHSALINHGFEVT